MLVARTYFCKVVLKIRGLVLELRLAIEAITLWWEVGLDCHVGGERGGEGQGGGAVRSEG